MLCSYCSSTRLVLVFCRCRGGIDTEPSQSQGLMEMENGVGHSPLTQQQALQVTKPSPTYIYIHHQLDSTHPRIKDHSLTLITTRAMPFNCDSALCQIPLTVKHSQRAPINPGFHSPGLDLHEVPKHSRAAERAFTEGEDNSSIREKINNSQRVKSTIKKTHLPPTTSLPRPVRHMMDVTPNPNSLLERGAKPPRATSTPHPTEDLGNREREQNKTSLMKQTNKQAINKLIATRPPHQSASLKPTSPGRGCGEAQSTDDIHTTHRILQVDAAPSLRPDWISSEAERRASHTTTALPSNPRIHP